LLARIIHHALAWLRLWIWTPRGCGVICCIWA